MVAGCKEEKPANPPPPQPAAQAAPAPAVVAAAPDAVQAEPDYTQAPPPPPPVEFQAPQIAPTFDLRQVAAYLEATHSRDLTTTMQRFEDALNQHFAADGYVEVYPEAYNGRYFKLTAYINKSGGAPGFHPGVNQVLFTVVQNREFLSNSYFDYTITGYDWNGAPLYPAVSGTFYAPEMSYWVNGYFYNHTMVWTPYYTNYNRVYYYRNTYMVSHPAWRTQNQVFLHTYNGPSISVHQVVAPRPPVAVNPAVRAPGAPALAVPAVKAPAPAVAAPAVKAPAIAAPAPAVKAPAPAPAPRIAPPVAAPAPAPRIAPPIAAPAPRIAPPIAAPAPRIAAPVAAPAPRIAPPVAAPAPRIAAPAPAPAPRIAPPVAAPAPRIAAPAPAPAPRIAAPAPPRAPSRCFNPKKC